MQRNGESIVQAMSNRHRTIRVRGHSFVARFISRLFLSQNSRVPRYENHCAPTKYKGIRDSIHATR